MLQFLHSANCFMSICLVRTDYTDLTSSVPTKDQVLVPETLLKKRKSQEQARAERRAEAEKKKQVSKSPPIITSSLPNYLMTTPTTRLDQWSMLSLC